ncbi:unnamed protein product [Polarella glacialis]|uniref:N-acetylglucosaminylphosphatidylinositol deacetylase n=1 Tax=Polarella glacialis TaxID=89957 RepID=A0A813EU47_POLGL|nr:unnamed protein product [Polarella glacialis]CAE8675095.1 unnamed protein product [Polarella glacialis]
MELSVLGVLLAFLLVAVAAVMFRSAGCSEALAAYGIRPQDSVLLVVAHPDDEAMFFWPTLLGLRSAGVRLSVLCLSTGNFDGLGAVRRAEMQRSCASLGIVGDALKVVDVPELQDGPRSWEEAEVAKVVKEHLHSTAARFVLTFDEQGVSGHPNHVSTSRGVRVAAARSSEAPPCVLMLDSVSFAVKYLGALHLLTASRSSFSCSNLLACLSALSVHRSQLVWYRILFTMFSSYSYVNAYTEVALTKLKDRKT